MNAEVYLNLDGTTAREITAGNDNGLKTFAFKQAGDLCFEYHDTCFHYREAQFLKDKEVTRIAALQTV